MLQRKKSIDINDARIAGLYDLDKTIGKGHFAVVKLARHCFTGEKVAVKVIDKLKLDSASMMHIMQEVRCMKLVQHPSIVRLYEVIDTQTKLFLILELGDFDMYEYLEHKRAGKGLCEAEAQRHFAQVVDAINYCHKLHVVHRDLKPENVVFFEKVGMVKLTDFGFSNVYTPGNNLNTSCGSLAYSAPEILLGDKYDAPAVDVWSMGVILYMLVVGKLPFYESNDSETLTKILDCSYVLPNYLSDDCKDLIKRVLQREPGKRATLSEVVEHAWVSAGRTSHIEHLPLVGREHLTDDDHDAIVEQMVIGNISTAEAIQKALDSDDYSHITATYYLLAERVLRSAREQIAQNLMAQNSKSNPELATPQTESNVISDDLATVSASQDDAHKTWTRQRSCSMVKEESEDEICGMPCGSKANSRRSSRATSPSTSLLALSSRVSPAAIQEMLDITGRASSGRRSPSDSSRSPSPTQLGIIHRLKATSLLNSRKLSSSPHLREICEEVEDELCTSPNLDFHHRARKSSAHTYSAARMIRPRHAIVNPDVIKRYERGSTSEHQSAPPSTSYTQATTPSSHRSHRSTSCSSSEASDDEGRSKCRHHRHHHNRHKKDDGHDGAGSVGASKPDSTSTLTGKQASGSHQSTSSEPTNQSEPGNSSKCSACGGIDASRLLCKLQKLALAPIRELPFALPRFLQQRKCSAQLSLRRSRVSSGTFDLVTSQHNDAYNDMRRSSSRTWHRLRRARSVDVILLTSHDGDRQKIDQRGDELCALQLVELVHRLSPRRPSIEYEDETELNSALLTGDTRSLIPSF